MKVLNSINYHRFINKKRIIAVVFEDEEIPGNKSFIKKVQMAWHAYGRFDCRVMAWKDYKNMFSLKNNEWAFAINFYSKRKEIFSLLNPSTDVLHTLFKVIKKNSDEENFIKEMKNAIIQLIPTLYNVNYHFQIPFKQCMKEFYIIIDNQVKIEKKLNRQKIECQKRDQIIKPMFSNNLKEILAKNIEAQNFLRSLNHTFLIKNTLAISHENLLKLSKKKKNRPPPFRYFLKKNGKNTNLNEIKNKKIECNNISQNLIIDGSQSGQKQI